MSWTRQVYSGLTVPTPLLKGELLHQMSAAVFGESRNVRMVYRGELLGSPRNAHSAVETRTRQEDLRTGPQVDTS